jgi:hypothetical protein
LPWNQTGSEDAIPGVTTAYTESWWLTALSVPQPQCYNQIMWMTFLAKCIQEKTSFTTSFPLLCMPCRWMPYQSKNPSVILTISHFFHL